MSERMGPIDPERSGGEQVFLGRDWMCHWSYSEEKATATDSAACRALSTPMPSRRLREHHSLLDRIADVLLERETLDGGDDGWVRGLPAPCAVYADAGPRRSLRLQVLREDGIE